MKEGTSKALFSLKIGTDPTSSQNLHACLAFVENLTIWALGTLCNQFFASSSSAAEVSSFAASSRNL